MTMREPEPGVQELFRAIAACAKQSTPLHAVAVRSAAVRYASEEDFLSGYGAASRGGRWNPRGVRAVYGSLSVETAVKEAYQNILQFGFAKAGIRPRVLAGMEVRLQSVLDLTDRGIRRRLGFSLNDLLDEDWEALQGLGEESWTQTIGRAALAAGFEALLAPSARDRPRGKNVVIFPDNLRDGSRILILGSNDLPPHPSKWPA